MSVTVAQTGADGGQNVRWWPSKRRLKYRDSQYVFVIELTLLAES